MSLWGSSKWLTILLSLAIGTAGGFIALYAGIPLPFLIGSMIACMGAALVRVPVDVPYPLLNPLRTVLGLLLGTAITPALFAAPSALWLSAGLMPVYVLVTSLAGTWFYQVAGGYERRVAFFCATPGGLITMTLMAEELGVDVRKVALAHAARIVLVVTVLPVLIGLWTGGFERLSATNMPGLMAVSLTDLSLLLAAAVLGMIAGRIIRLPGAPILGPMIVSAGLSLSGILTARPPAELVVAAQIVLGASIGSRFVGTGMREIVQTSLLSAGLVSLSLGITAAVAWGIYAATGAPFVNAVLAFAPGGLAEMSLVALALGYDVGMVASLHLVRVLMIALLAPLSVMVFRRPSKP